MSSLSKQYTPPLQFPRPTTKKRPHPLAKRRSKQPRQKQIVAIGGGKGGVGKSFVSGNLGVLLVQQGSRVVLLDMDLGGANLHTCLGVQNLEKGLSDFLDRKVDTLDAALTDTRISGLRLLSGAQDGSNVANLKYAQKMRLLRALRSLDADYLFMDLGAGTSYNTLDFFLAADLQILVVIPEPTSIENAYRFLKSTFYRQIRHNSPDAQVRSLVDEAMNPNNSFGIRTPQDLIKHLSSLGSEMEYFAIDQARMFCPKIILNQTRSQRDIQVGLAMEKACLKYFGLSVECVGYIQNTDDVRNSVLQRSPLVLFRPDSLAAQNLRNIASKVFPESCGAIRTGS